MYRFIIAWLATLSLASAVGAQSRYAEVSDARDVEKFLGELQSASRSDDRNAIASLIHYPVTVLIEGLRVPFNDSATLLERYEAIFTPTLRETIARAVAPDRPQPGREPMTVNPNGTSSETTPSSSSRSAIG